MNRRLAQKALKERLDFHLKQAFNLEGQALKGYGVRIKAVNLQARAEREGLDLVLQNKRMDRAATLALKAASGDLKTLDNRMKTLGKERAKPRVRLGNLYIRSTKEVKVDDVLSVDLLDGSIETRVLSIERNGHEL